MNDENKEFNYYKNENIHTEKKRSYPSYVLISLASGLIGALIFAFIFGNIENNNKSESRDKKVIENNKITIKASENMNIPQAVAEKTMESVVGITSREIRTGNDLFFGTTKQLVEGVGSGIIVSENGYIVTNSHVIANGKAESLKVLFMNGDEKDADVIWLDQTLDLAVIKVEGEKLKPAELGDSDKIKIGQPAIAIGNPLGLEFERTVTSGIISGLNRTIQMSENDIMEGLIQTDASINSGNSGGPLLDKEGKVIGINTLKIQSVEGMGFAQPINLVKSVIDQIVLSGKFDDVYMGIYGENVKRYQKAKGIELGVEYGTLVTAIEKNSPADEAGLKAGDIITSINGDKVESLQSLRKILYKYKPGESIVVGIVRNKQASDINLVLKNIKEFKY